MAGAVHSSGPGMRVSAPGKMMVVGEYAVLFGVPAVVAAVDLRVQLAARCEPLPTGYRAELPPEAEATRQVAENAYGAADGPWMLNVEALRSGDQKLGVGSSAAAAAAAAGWVLAAAGHSLEDPSVRRQAFELALAGHHAVAPRGSGADVAACSLGGFVHFVRSETGEVQARSLAFPQEPVLRAVWTGKQVRTSGMLDAVEQLRARDPRLLRERISALGREAEAFIAAAERGDVRQMIGSTADYGKAMGDLGNAIGVPIVEETLDHIAQLASRAGGAAKPSGAGGGDVALAMFPDDRSARQFDEACASEGLRVLHLELGAQGIRVDVEEHVR